MGPAFGGTDPPATAGGSDHSHSRLEPGYPPAPANRPSRRAGDEAHRVVRPAVKKPPSDPAIGGDIGTGSARDDPSLAIRYVRHRRAKARGTGRSWRRERIGRR